MVIEAGFADRHDLGMLRARNQIAHAHVEFLMGIMWVRADRAIDVGKALGDGQHLIVSAHAGRNRDHPLHTCRPRPTDDGVQLGGKIGKIEMAMAVDQHFLFYCAARLSGST